MDLENTLHSCVLNLGSPRSGQEIKTSVGKITLIMKLNSLKGYTYTCIPTPWYQKPGINEVYNGFPESPLNWRPESKDFTDVSHEYFIFRRSSLFSNSPGFRCLCQILITNIIVELLVSCPPLIRRIILLAISLSGTPSAAGLFLEDFPKTNRIFSGFPLLVITVYVFGRSSATATDDGDAVS